MKKIHSDIINIMKANLSGMNRNFGEKNGNYKNGSRLHGNFPCPICNHARFCDARNGHRMCKKCYLLNKKTYSNKEIKELRQNYQQNSKRNFLTNKENYIVKRGNKCEICLITYPMDIYEFHHKYPEKKTNEPAKIFRYGKERFDLHVEELDECLLLCPTCHALIERGYL